MDKKQLLRLGGSAAGAVLPFWLLDLTLRAATGCAAWYPLYAAAPNLFSLGFGALFAALCLLSQRRTVGRILYGLIYTVWAVYAVIQYGIWRIFNRFLFLSDFLFAGEGLGFAGYIRQLIDMRFVLVVVLLVLWGGVGRVAAARQSAAAACLSDAGTVLCVDAVCRAAAVCARTRNARLGFVAVEWVRIRAVFFIHL